MVKVECRRSPRPDGAPVKKAAAGFMQKEERDLDTPLRSERSELDGGFTVHEGVEVRR